jgi:hypothetical protein
MRRQHGASNQAQISVQYAQVPEALSSGSTYSEGGYLEAQNNGSDLLIRILDVARFLVRGTNEILIDPAPDASENDICAYLLGTVFGAFCHRCGILPLHASAIDFEDGCVAFTGHSGAGKSTLAAALGARGHQVISDDVCFLREDEDGNILTWPGIGRIRLWPDAIDALEYDQSIVERELRGYNKFLVPVAPPREPFAPRRLLRVYQLAAASADGAPSVVQLQGAKRIELLVPNVYRLTLAEHMGAKPAIFSLCAAIAQQVPIYEFRRPLSFEGLPTALDILERHLDDAR